MTTNAQKIDRSSPTAYRFRIGTLLESLIAQVNALRTDLANLYAQGALLITAPTLVIKAADATVPKSSTAFSALIAGTVVAKTADTDMTALVGTLATAKYAAWAFEMDSAGTITTRTKTADQTTAAAAVAALAATTANKVRLGYVVIANTSGSNFVGGTTALDVTGIAVTYVPASGIAMPSSAVDTLS